MFPTIVLAMKGFGGVAMAALFGTWLLCVILGRTWARETCSEPAETGVNMREARAGALEN